MYLKHTECLIHKFGRQPPHNPVQPADSMNASVSRCVVALMRLEWQNKPNTTNIYCRRRNFSRACLRWIMRSYIWMRLRLPRPTLLHRLTLIWFLANKASGCVMRGRCVEVRLEVLPLLLGLLPPLPLHRNV